MAFLSARYRPSCVLVPQVMTMAPLSHASFGDMFDPDVPGIQQIDGQSVVGSSRITNTGQGSKVDNHRKRTTKAKRTATRRR